MCDGVLLAMQRWEPQVYTDACRLEPQRRDPGYASVVALLTSRLRPQFSRTVPVPIGIQWEGLSCDRLYTFGGVVTVVGTN